MMNVLGFFLLFVVEIMAFALIKRRQRNKGVNNLYRFLTLIFFIFIWIITLKYVVFPPMRNIPTTGKYQVTSSDYWIDEDEADPYLEDGSIRELQVRKWYPVDSSEELPVIVASHGSCGTIDNNASLYKEMASHGYTVLAVCHPGQAATVTYKDGTGAGPSMTFIQEMSTLQPQESPEQAYELFTKWMDIRRTDLNAVMDDYIDRVGKTDFVMMGHSLGGSAAYCMTRIRDDVVGCIALESPCMYDIKGVQDGEFVFDSSDYDVPLLNIYSDASYKHLTEWGQYKNNAMFLNAKNQNYTNIYYEGTGHMGLCDLSLASPILSDMFSGEIQKTGPYTQLTKLNEDCMKWLNKYFGPEHK